jgi:hypothetical protein
MRGPRSFWRRRAIAEVQELERSLKRHCDDINRVHAQLAHRVSGIEDALSLLAQAAARLAVASDDMQSPARRKTPSTTPQPNGGGAKPTQRLRRSPPPADGAA